MRLTHAVIGIARYLWLTAWPADLVVYYPHPLRMQWGWFTLAIIVLVGLGYAVVRAAKRQPAIAVGAAWFLGTLVPVIGIVQVGQQAIADRYTYIPTMGLCLMLAACARSAWPVFALAVPILFVVTEAQVRTWKDSLTLFTRCVEHTENNALAQHHLGSALLERGDFEGARAHFLEALRLHPTFTDARNNLGAIAGHDGHNEEAIAYFRAELATRPDAVDARTNLGYALVKLGRVEEGMLEYRRALAVDPDFAQANKKLGAALGGQGKFAEALYFIDKAVKRKPEDAEARRTLAVTYMLLDDAEQGVAQYLELLARDPGDIDALNNVAWLRATHKQAEHRNAAQAVEFAERAIKLCPTPQPILQDTLAAAYAEAGRYDEAIAACTRAIELARAAQDEVTTKRFEGHLARLREHKPLHES